MFNRKKRNIFGSTLVIALLMSCLVASAMSADAKPAVTLEPESGKAEAELKITGTGFQPEEEIDIILTLGEGLLIGLGTTKVEMITADQNGSFTAVSAIPKMAKPGEYPIDVIGSMGSEASAKLTVLPKQ